MATKKVYICFEYDKDRMLKDLLIGQSRNPESPFEVIDRSLVEASEEDGWEEKAKDKIKTADRVIVLLGASTYRAPGVLKEVAIARDLGKKVIQLIGYKDHKYKRVPGAGTLYRWTWENLKKILN
ncbi:MAG TPA: TIR domain-containing protein [Puia sp.]|jgi:hypothetical protein|nr:TIR domain-containing protein [Puia sp.]